MGLVLGPDVGFAGGGLWLLMLPPAVLALIGGALVSYTRQRLSLATRHLTFALLSPVLSFGIAVGVPLAFFGASSRSPLHISQRVYVPAADFRASVDIHMYQGSFVRSGDRGEIQVERKAGPWLRVKKEQVPAGAPAFTELPSANDPEISGVLRWRSEPPTCMQVVSFNEKASVATAVFSAPGDGNNCRIWASIDDRLRSLRPESLALEVSFLP